MSSLSKDLLGRFIRTPPRLRGGLSLHLDSVSDREARLRVEDRHHRFEGIAAALTVPYASGLLRLLGATPHIDVVLVERASSSLLSAARRHGVGCLDMEGYGRLSGPGFTYVAEPSDPRGTGDRRATRSPTGTDKSAPTSTNPFAPRATRVTRLLLCDPSRVWRLSELAATTRLNPGNVHRILRALTARGLVERDDAIYRVPDPGSLLDAWAEGDSGPKRTAQRLVPVGSALHREVAGIVRTLDGRAAVSGELACELYAPYLSASHALVHVFDHYALDALADEHQGVLVPPRSSARIVLRVSDDAVADGGAMRSGFPLVAPQQVYVDLRHDLGRGREAAEHMRREALGF